MNKTKKRTIVGVAIISGVILVSVSTVGTMRLINEKNAVEGKTYLTAETTVFNETTQANTWDLSKNQDGSITASLDNAGTLTISGTGEMQEWTNESSVPFYSERDKVKKVVIEEGITTIGRAAFYGCSSLTSVEILNGVTSISQDAFKGCSSLISVEIPSSVTSIGVCAFEGCSNLTSVEIPSSVTSIGKNAFNGCSSLTIYCVAGSYAEDYAKTNNINYQNNNNTWDLSKNQDGSITAVLDDAGTLTISGTGEMQEWTNEGSVPFYSEKDKVKKVVIEEGVTSIGFCTFRTYTNIESVELPESLEIIGQSAFDRCSSLTSINIPKSVKEIKDYAFWKCTSLKEINMTKGLETIGAYAFGNTAVETVVLPEGLKTIKEYAFAESQKIKSIEIPASVEKIEGAAFYSIGYNCTSITIDSKNQNYISEEGIIYTKDKTRLVHYLISREDTTYKIPESVQIIDKGAFAWCNRLTEITIPSNVKEIGSAAFRGDKKLKTVKIKILL